MRVSRRNNVEMPTLERDTNGRNNTSQHMLGVGARLAIKDIRLVERDCCLPAHEIR
jgi:hypothetical protein